MAASGMLSVTLLNPAEPIISVAVSIKSPEELVTSRKTNSNPLPIAASTRACSMT